MSAVGPPSDERDPYRVARLRLVASSIAGRTVDVHPTEAGQSAWTDGRNVFVPLDADARRRLQYVAVQASLIAAGSLDAAVMRRLVGRATLAQRYLAIEVPRALAGNEERLPPAAVTLIARPIARAVRTALQSLALAQEGSGKPELPTVFGTLRPRAVLAATADDVLLPPAVDPSQLAARPAHLADSDSADSDDEADERLLAMLSDRSGTGGLLGRLIQRMLGRQRDAGTGPLGGELLPRSRVVAARPGRGGRGRTPAAPLEPGVMTPESAGWVYPEWDVRRGDYNPDWCVVQEEEASLEHVVSTIVSPALLRGPLSRLGLGLELTHRRLQGDDLDIDAAVEARVDALAGAEPADAVYLESLRRRHDLAVLLLLDISGSSNEPSVAGRSVHHQQLAGATALVQAMHGLGNRVAVYGFYSKGRSAVRVVRVKRFNDDMDLGVLRRLGSLTPAGYTRLGAVIRHGAAMVEQGPGSRPLLIVLSDGFAFDHGYDGRYAEADARRALVEARRRGIGCLCLSIGAGTDLTTLRRVFGSAAHASVARPEDIVPMVGPLFRDALRAAELQQSVAQRKYRVRRRSDADRRSA